MSFHKKILIAVLVTALLLGFGLWGWWIHVANKHVEAVNLVIQGNPTEEQLVSFLKSKDRILLSNTLTVLERRRVAGGKEMAANLLTHPDPYVWFGASLYLGSLGDQRSVPYLIRGLDHPAWRSRPRVVSYLRSLTGQDYDDRKEEWIKWWAEQHQGTLFNFASVTTGAMNEKN